MCSRVTFRRASMGKDMTLPPSPQIAVEMALRAPCASAARGQGGWNVTVMSLIVAHAVASAMLCCQTLTQALGRSFPSGAWPYGTSMQKYSLRQHRLKTLSEKNSIILTSLHTPPFLLRLLLVTYYRSIRLFLRSWAFLYSLLCPTSALPPFKTALYISVGRSRLSSHPPPPTTAFPPIRWHLTAYNWTA